ncbi:hypothetical protein PV325_013222, partial [Microctonus aethiopoides]
ACMRFHHSGLLKFGLSRKDTRVIGVFGCVGERMGVRAICGVVSKKCIEERIMKKAASRCVSWNGTIKVKVEKNKIYLLPRSFNKSQQFIVAWKSASSNEKTLEKLTARLLKEETRNKNKEEESEVAFQSIEKFCKNSKMKTHYTRSCKKPKKE